MMAICRLGVLMVIMQLRVLVDKVTSRHENIDAIR
jgi:hypothetical protein